MFRHHHRIRDGPRRPRLVQTCCCYVATQCIYLCCQLRTTMPTLTKTPSQCLHPKYATRCTLEKPSPNWLHLRNFKICAMVLLLYKRKYEQNIISFSSTAYVIVRTIFSKKNGYYHSSPQSLHLVEGATMKTIYLCPFSPYA